MSTLMSMRQYAKKRGVSPEAVSKAVRTGRISTVNDEKGQRKINPDVADREWAQNSEGIRPNYGIPSSEPQPEEQPQAEEKPKGPSVHQSAAVLKAYQARLAKLEFEEKAGKLISAEEVKRESFKTARGVRDALMGIPDRVSAEFAGETDQFAIRKRLETEIRQALESLATQLETESA